MWSAIVLLLTLCQAIIIGVSYNLHLSGLFLGLVVYGSPFYLLMTLLGVDSAFMGNNPIYIGIFIYHVVKYFCFFKAHLIDDSNWRRNLAILLEAAYLALTGYYAN